MMREFSKSDRMYKILDNVTMYNKVWFLINPRIIFRPVLNKILYSFNLKFNDLTKKFNGNVKFFLTFANLGIIFNGIV